MLATVAVAGGARVAATSRPKNVYAHQPAKLAAFEGHFETGPADLSLFGIPDDDERDASRFNIAIPGGLSFLLHEDFDDAGGRPRPLPARGPAAGR